MKPRIKTSTLHRVIKEELELSKRTGLNLTPVRLMSALRQRGHILEGIEELSLDHEELGDSIDVQVDNYLATYENTAKTTQAEGIDWRSDVRDFLTEAEGDEEEEAEGGEEEPESEVEEPSKMSVHDIDVESFANSVARMIENYDSLLEIQNTLIRRSTNFIAKNYDDEVVKLLKTALKEQHGLVPGKSKGELEGEEFAAPRAGEAGPLGGV